MCTSSLSLAAGVVISSKRQRGFAHSFAYIYVFVYKFIHTNL